MSTPAYSLVGVLTPARSSVCRLIKTWLMQMSAMLSLILLAASPLAGTRPDFTTIPGHKNFVDLTAACCSHDSAVQHEKRERTYSIALAVTS